MASPELLSAFRIAVLIPCYNEAVAVAQVIGDFRAALPGVRLYVYDNNSTDQTSAVAAAAGAVVRVEPLQGKGNVVRRMFADIEADIYVLVDGDATYDAASAPGMIERLVTERLDMLVGTRVDAEIAAYRPGHRFGNRALTGFVGYLFGERFSDILSGYRILSRRYVKSFPALAAGFEIETELTVHALELRMPVAEVATPYHSRPPGSASKLNTLRDGWRIGWTIISLFKDERPLIFFLLAFAALALLSVGVAAPVILDFLDTGLVARLPTAVLATGIMLLAFLSLACGFILDTVTHGRRELKRLAYLTVPALDSEGRT
jgi:glycosyltransferase involved in cell wall biosynthesis